MLSFLKKSLKRWKTGFALQFLARIQRITHRMPVELRKVKKSRVLVLAPHMDDEVIGPGGTLILHGKAGSSVGVIFTTDSSGPKTQHGEQPITVTRKAEAKEVATTFGFEVLEFLDLPDGSLTLHEKELGDRLTKHLISWKPDLIFVPFPGDHHRDHQATSAGLVRALELTGWKGEVWCYEIWSTLWPNVDVDISSVVDEKKQAIGLHASQVKEMGYIEAAMGLNRYRGLKVRVPFAEAFFVGSQSDYLNAARLLNQF